MDTSIKHPVSDRERQSAQMSKITNDGLTRSDTGGFIAVSIWPSGVFDRRSDGLELAT